MRDLDVRILTETTARLLVESNYRIPPDILAGLRRAATAEESELGRQTLEHLIHNYEVAAAEQLPVCQDSGITVVLLEIGQEVHWTGGNLQEAIFEGITQGTKQGYLRWSLVGDPLARRNPGGTPPGVIHYDIVPGDGVRLTVASKGFGAENMSALRMFTPADGIPAVKQFVVDTIDRAGANACPPVVVGVGIGGTFEKSAILSKKALFRELGSPNPDAMLDGLEKELLERANRLGIGPQGYGGDTTSLGIHVIAYPCHITSLPVAVTIECHAHRHKEATL